MSLLKNLNYKCILTKLHQDGPRYISRQSATGDQ